MRGKARAGLPKQSGTHFHTVSPRIGCGSPPTKTPWRRPGSNTDDNRAQPETAAKKPRQTARCLDKVPAVTTATADLSNVTGREIPFPDAENRLIAVRLRAETTEDSAVTNGHSDKPGSFAVLAKTRGKIT